jgi:hypothetical protein
MNPKAVQNPRVGDKYANQGVAVSHVEKELIHVLAVAAGIKPGTAARHLLFRGLEGYLQDRNLSGEEFDVTIVARLQKLVATDPKLKRAAEIVRTPPSPNPTPTVTDSEIKVEDPARGKVSEQSTTLKKERKKRRA